MEGNITFDKDNIKDYTLDALLQSIGYVPQDHFLFSMNIANNIRFADPMLSQEKVGRSSRFTAIHQDVQQFTDGYETMVAGRRGFLIRRVKDNGFQSLEL